MNRDNGTPVTISKFLPNLLKKQSILEERTVQRIVPNSASDTCTLEELNSINQKKELGYIYLSSHLLRQLGEDKKLKPSAKYLWILLFDLSKFNKENRQITISTRNLAKKTGLSKPTIEKCLAELEKNFFIIKSKNRIKNNSNTTTYIIRVPTSYIKKSQMAINKKAII